MHRLTYLLLTAVLVTIVPFAEARERGVARITFLRGGASGVSASASTYTLPIAADSPKGFSVNHHSPAPAPAPAPAPVAISAHNCVPRLDPRGVSLSLEFSEGAGDCISFVSPAPAPERDLNRRPKKPAVTPEQLALTAYERAISLAPEPEIGIAPAETGLTGLDSFFWTDEPPPVTATARAGRLTVSAEARPVRYLWDFGDGTLDSTRHPGRPWSRARPGDIAHLYETKGRYTVELDVVWAARWRTNGGPWRDLGYFSTSASAAYPVRGMIAVLVRGR